MLLFPVTTKELLILWATFDDALAYMELDDRVPADAVLALRQRVTERVERLAGLTGEEEVQQPRYLPHALVLGDDPETGIARILRRTTTGSWVDAASGATFSLSKLENRQILFHGVEVP